MNSDVKNSQDALDSCRWTQMSFHIHPGPTRVYSRSPTPLLSTVQVTGSVPLEQPTQLSVQRAVGAMGQCLRVTTSQTALSSAPWPLHWLPCERGAPVLWGQLRFLSPSRAGTQVPGAHPPVSATAPDHILPEPQTHLTHSSPAQELPTALICFTSFAFSRWLATLTPCPTCALSLPGGVRDRNTVPGGEAKSTNPPPNP